MSSTSRVRNPTSVHDSNAGHDFHVLWATRRLIELLNPASKLQAVKMEGVAAEDLTQLSASEDHFLAADLTEYYGGNHFEEADRTIIAQLKYSTRHPNNAWTGGRLRKRKGKNDSVIERLAAAYKDLIDSGHSRDAILQKTCIRLISNQPLQPKIAKFFRDIKATLKVLGPNQIILSRLVDEIQIEHQNELNKFFNRVGLSEELFTDFCRIVDFSGCGAKDRLGQRLAILQELAPSVPTGEKDVFLRLTDLVRQNALPENQHAAPIVQADVLAQLQVFSEKDLFPEPPAFNYPKNPVPTNEASNIAISMLPTSNRRIIVHGAAGVGKTTTVQQVHSHLPAGSVTILYDCYGDGTYYNLNTGRHTIEHAFLQLSNELALVTGLPFLVTTPTSRYKLIDYFQNRLDAAAKVVEAAGGLLVLIIDAADNSIVRSYKESISNCFVPNLWELNLPSNCRLLMTSRTHRKDSLQAPGGTQEIELTGFDSMASGVRLHQVFPLANTRSIQVFHQRTGGNPRVQEYWLDPGSNIPGSYAAFLHSFRRNSTTATEIIEDIVKSAVVEVLNPSQAQDQLAILVCLQRPIPITVFAQASNISIEQASNFCHALKPGLLLEDGLIGFRDEDFETQLRVRHDTETRLNSTHERLGDHFLSLSASDAYAGQAVAEHLSAAGRLNDLIELALNGPSVGIIPDSSLRLRTERRRIKLALQAAATLRQDLKGAKVAILAAETLRANSAVKNLVLADVELAAHFGDTGTVADYFQAGVDDENLRSVHYRLAAHYARSPSQHATAKRHLAHALAWVRRYMRLPQHERQQWEITDLDIACEIETIYWLENPMAAYNQMQRWRPARARLRVLHTLLGRLSTTKSVNELESQLCQINLPLLGQCVAQAALWRFGYVVSKEWCEKVANRLLPLLRCKKIEPVLERWPYMEEVTEFAAWPLHLAELYTHHKLDPESSILLLSYLLPAFPNSSPGNHSTYSELVTPIRAACLHAYLKGQKVSGQDLFPVSSIQTEKKSHDDRSSYEAGEYRRSLDLFINLYTFRAKLLNSTVTLADLEKVVLSGLEKLYPDRNTTDHFYRHRQAQWLRSAISLVARVGGAESLLKDLANNAHKFVGRYHTRQLWLHMADEILAFPSYKSIAFHCLERTANDADEDNLPVNDRWPILLECAKKSLIYDEEFSRDFYRRALDASHQGVGDDVAHRLEIGAQVANQLGSHLSLEEGYNIGKKLSALVEAYKPFVTEDDVYMPTDAALKAVTKLNPAAGVALCLRWDVINFQAIEESIIAVAEGATARYFWHPAQSLWLHKLCGDSVDISHFALEILSKLPTTSAEQRKQIQGPLSAIARWVAKDVPLNRRIEPLKRIISWADEHQQLHLPAIKALQQTVNYVETTINPVHEPQHSEASQFEVSKQEKKAKWYDAASKGKINSFVQWQEAFPYEHEEMVPAILELADHVLPKQRPEVLELLVKVQGFFGNPRDVALDALEKLLHRWQKYGPVQDWAQRGIPRFYSCHLFRLTREKDWPPRLEQLCNLPLADSSRACLLLPGIASELDSLGPEHVCRVAAALTKTSGTAELKEFIDWHLNRMEGQLKADDKTLPFQDLLSSTGISTLTPSALFAKFIWTVFGNPDKRVRWRAIHAAHQLFGMSENEEFRKEFIAEIIKLSLDTDHLLPEKEEFYWQGARVYVLVLLDRIAYELPDELTPHLDAIKFHAFNPNFPHAQIRELARRILIKLNQIKPNVLNRCELEQVELVNRPKGCIISRGSRIDAPEVLPKIQAKKEFEFDRMDTVDYWFRPLSRVFGQSENKILALVEHWICEKWGRTEKECQEHHLHDSRRYDWRLTRHYKLDDTTVDNLKMHLTHHALMCVAGELADKFPMRVEDYTEALSSWEEWLKRYLPSSFSKNWISDWRGPTPLNENCWGKLPTPWNRKTSRQFYEELGLFEPSRDGWLVVYGNYSFGKDEKYGDVYLSSVQVSPEASYSLLYALQSVKSNDYSFPTFGLSDSDPDLPEGIPSTFTLFPLIKEEENEYQKGLEQHDESSRGVHTTYPLLNEDIITRCSLTVGDSGKKYYDTDGLLAAEYEIWDDDLRDNHRSYDRQAYSSGFRLWMKWDVLQHYLTLTGRNILFQVTLSRNYSSSSYSNKERSYDLGKRRLALLRQDGTFETVAGNCSPWPAHSS